MPSNAPSGWPGMATWLLKSPITMKSIPGASDRTLLRFRAHCTPTSHEYSACCSGRRLSDTSQPRFWMVAAFAPSWKKPVPAGETGLRRMTSCDFLLYQVMLASARSLMKPRSRPASNSLDRSGLRVVAGFKSCLVTRPPIPFCVGVFPVPWEIPPTRPLEKVSEVRYGCGSTPASP